MAMATANDRITEARTTGAEAIVTACPWCKRNLSDAIDESGQEMDVIDIVELLERAL
jgi:Fe-S oxidoreductase